LDNRNDGANFDLINLQNGEFDHKEITCHRIGNVLCSWLNLSVGPRSRRREPGAGRALGRAAQVELAQVGLAQVRLAQVRHAQVRLAQVVGPVAVIPQWISKMQVECRGREVPSIEPDSRRSRWCAHKYWGLIPQ
jgi:hypothetical protein